MSKSKRILYVLTLLILLFLVVCTFVSRVIFEARLPNVEVMNPIAMELSGNQHDRVIPYSAIMTDEATGRHFVYVARSRQGLFGDEYVVTMLEVPVIYSDEIYAAIGGWNVMVFDSVVVYSSRFLASGEVVRVAGRCE